MEYTVFIYRKVSRYIEIPMSIFIQALYLRLLLIYLQILYELFHWLLRSKDKFKEALSIKPDYKYGHYSLFSVLCSFYCAEKRYNCDPFLQTENQTEKIIRIRSKKRKSEQFCKKAKTYQ